MSLLSNIVGAFNPRGAAAAPPPSPASPATPPTQPVADAGAGSVAIQPQQGSPAVETSGVQEPVPSVMFEPERRSAAETLPIYSVPPVAGAPASAKPGALREIGLPQFARVRLQPAAPASAGVPTTRPDAEAVPVAAEQPQLEPVMQAASIYTRAVYLLMAEGGPTTQQRIMRSL